MKTHGRPNKRASLTALTSPCPPKTKRSVVLVCRAQCYGAGHEATCLPLLPTWLLLHAFQRSLSIIPRRKEKAIEMYSTFLLLGEESNTVVTTSDSNKRLDASVNSSDRNWASRPRVLALGSSAARADGQEGCPAPMGAQGKDVLIP